MTWYFYHYNTESAPVDADLFCIDETLGFSGISLSYPSNTRILMDSFQYINLLPPHDSATWQQVDNDNNNALEKNETL